MARLELLVQVPEPLCAEAPTFDLSISGDAAIWAPMGSSQEVIINGRVLLADECELDGGVSWTVDDESDDRKPGGVVTEADLGEDLSFEVSISPSRSGGKARTRTAGCTGSSSRPLLRTTLRARASRRSPS